MDELTEKIIEAADDVIDRDLKYICDRAKPELMKMAGKKLLIVGGAGFLGYYFIQSVLNWNADKYKKQKIELTVIDNFSRGFPDFISELKKNKKLKVFEHDITEPFPKHLGDFQFVIHAASIASPIFYRLNPIETMDANVTGLRRLLDYCLGQKDKENKVEGLLFFSTSEIYGDPQKEFIPTSENYRGNVSCTGPRACYDESKRFGETLCVNFANQYGLPIKVARPFNNYGPGLKISDRRVLPDFARNIISGEDIIMLSDGTPSRTFCYISDAIIGYFKILINGRHGEAYNIGVEEPEISMLELAKRLSLISKELFGYNGKVITKKSEDIEYLTDNPNRRCPIINKARRELGYNPEIELNEGLRRSLIWYKANHQAINA